MSAMRVCVPGAQYFLKIKQILSSCRLAKGCKFLKGAQNQFKMLLEMSNVLASIVPTEREMQTYWRLCDNSESHLWLWKVWSLVICSQSSFYFTRARKDDKNRQNTLFLLKKDELGTQQTIIT